MSSALDDQEYLRQFRKKLARDRVPYTGSMEPTHRCNLKCVHCYLGDQAAIARERRHELTTDQWRAVLDEMAAAGCVELLITGGEPMLRRDFAEIYAHAKERGMVVTVFCNGTLVTRQIADLFVDRPPALVEISLYGATAETHDWITQTGGSFDRCRRGIELLLERKVRVGLKTVLMNLNRHEVRGMERMAKKHRVKFRLDSAVFPCLPNQDSGAIPNRCSMPPPRERGEVASDRRVPAVDLRVDPAQAAKIEFSDARRARAFLETLVKMRKRPLSDCLYTCGAGLTGFHVDPYGYLQPCLLTTGYRHDLLELGFGLAWQRLGRIRRIKAPAEYECNRCEKQPICSGCPALFDLENGAAAVKSSYICSVAQRRFEYLQQA